MHTVLGSVIKGFLGHRRSLKVLESRQPLRRMADFDAPSCSSKLVSQIPKKIVYEAVCGA